jgi:60 kDa SS-A/Ro ribonucleoprotein
MGYAKHLAPKKPAVIPMPHKFQADSLTRLDRFLILGCEGGSYYATERKLTLDSAKCVLECASNDPKGTVDHIVAISVAGRAPKNDPAIFALALIAANGDQEARSLALQAMPQVCRTGTHLFQFVEAVTTLRGWGRALKNAVANWYLSKPADKLAYQVTKYAQRGGWSHRDLLRLSHPKGKAGGHKDVFQYVTQREKWLASTRAGTRLLVKVEEARTASITKLVKLINDEGLVREHIPTERLNEPEVWNALLNGMPITAMIRNLNKLTSVGVIAPLSSGTRLVVSALTSKQLLKDGKVHPFNLLVALKTYSSGAGFRGDKTWTPVPQIVSALEDAFYLSFDTVDPTGKNHLFGIDVSGSMSSPIANTNISCATAAACLAMVGIRTEKNSYAFGFTSSFQDLGISKNDSLATVEQKVRKSNFGSTNCATPMTYALQNKLDVDAFVVLTDNETNCGPSPAAALEKYRQATGRDAKLIVCGMTVTDFTVGDPNDPGTLNVVGFDTAAPAVMADFVRQDNTNKRRPAAAARRAA